MVLKVKHFAKCSAVLAGAGDTGATVARVDGVNVIARRITKTTIPNTVTKTPMATRFIGESSGSVPGRTLGIASSFLAPYLYSSPSNIEGSRGISTGHSEASYVTTPFKKYKDRPGSPYPHRDE